MPNFVKYLLVIAVCGIQAAIAGVPEPKDPREIVQQNFDQRLASTKELHAILLAATPLERRTFHEKTIDMLKNMPQQERSALAEKFRLQWKKLSDEQKKALKQERRSYIKALPDDERKELKKQRESMLEYMSRQEQKHLN